MKIDLSNQLAAEMDKVLNSDENKELFSTSSMLEKLAFKRVSEQDSTTEVEAELDAVLSKTADCKHCECKNTKHDKCKCDCHDKNEADDKDDKIETFPAPSGKGVNAPYVPGTTPPVKDTKKANLVRDAFHTLLVISEVLDDAGFEKIAAMSIMLADKLIVEAKAKKSDKKSKEDKSKSKSKKMDVAERMKKMRDAQKGKKKDDKKSDKKSKKTAQVQPPPQHMEPRQTPKREADIILGALNTDVRAAIVALEVMPTEQMGVRNVLVRFQPGQEKAMNAVKSTVNMLSQQNSLPGKTYTFTRV
jgi:hypothetical protein